MMPFSRHIRTYFYVLYCITIIDFRPGVQGRSIDSSYDKETKNAALNKYVLLNNGKEDLYSHNLIVVHSKQKRDVGFPVMLNEKFWKRGERAASEESPFWKRRFMNKFPFWRRANRENLSQFWKRFHEEAAVHDNLRTVEDGRNSFWKRLEAFNNYGDINSVRDDIRNISSVLDLHADDMPYLDRKNQLQRAVADEDRYVLDKFDAFPAQQRRRQELGRPEFNPTGW